MAYMTKLNAECQICKRQARYTVSNRYNAPMGQFCRACADKLVKDLDKEERVTGSNEEESE